MERMGHCDSWSGDETVSGETPERQEGVGSREFFLGYWLSIVVLELDQRWRLKTNLLEIRAPRKSPGNQDLQAKADLNL